MDDAAPLGDQVPLPITFGHWNATRSAQRGAVVLQNSSALQVWGFNTKDNVWERDTCVNCLTTLANAGNIAIGYLTSNPSIDDVTQVWLAGAGAGVRGLQRWNWEANSVSTGDALDAWAAAVDRDGKAYVVRINDKNFYELQRFAHGGGAAEHKATFPKKVAPVGSPILAKGREGSLPEVYVVDTEGNVYAFSSADLLLLWSLPLGIKINEKAQPLLVGDTLWVVGTRGQVRGVRVNASGLDREAHWPKHLKDNCNSSNVHSSAQTGLPGCF